MFESKKHYYKTLITTTDHLMQFLQADRNIESPIILFEQIDTWIKEINVRLQLHLHVVSLTPDSFTLKKYVVYHHPIYIESLKHMITLFCHHHLNGLAGNIEIINLLEGKVTKFNIEQTQVRLSLDYIELIKNMKQEAFPLSMDQRGFRRQNQPIRH
ncbi:hypothetical protein [Lihuaxuella thermophila]|uniref:hypothetical protein n=1 Tax=Lihuaxuella thermophila TaxID=1173111 RepID=UPI000B7E0D3E|nr:hypothetical protein [Lihuaxuella thermophila]